MRLLRRTVRDKRDLSSSTQESAPGVPEAEDPSFDEVWYLETYPDVAGAVAAGAYRSGLHHYQLSGQHEGRLGSRAKPTLHPDADLAALKQHHGGAAYLAPQDLRVAPFQLRRTLVIGICLAEAWTNNLGGTMEHQPDFLMVTQQSVMPTGLDHPAADYDVFLVQVPLRAVMGEGRLWRIPSADVDEHRRVFDEACEAIDAYVEKICAWAEPFGVPLLFGNFLLPQSDLTGRLLPRYDIRNVLHFTEELNRHLERSIARFSSTSMLDIDRIAASFGRRFIQDDSVLWTMHGSLMPTAWGEQPRIETLAPITEHYEITWPTGFVAAIWAEATAIVRTLRQVDLVKMVVVDLDDTLWMGVSGDAADIGPMMIEGWPLGFAEALIYLKKRGILLGIISKNDETRIRDIWPRIFRGQLTLEDFSVIRVNWQRKPENMAEILQAVNLLPESVVFIDDNPVERAAMRVTYPAMRILGRYPFYLRRILLWAPETQVARISAESASRTRSIHAKIERDHAQRTLDRDAFLTTLGLRVKTFEVDLEHPAFARSFELLNKTNQFNTTGRRWTLAAMTSAVRDGLRLFAFEAEDTFTAYGLVGVCLAGPAVIEQFVMSCRVNGLDVELAAMSDIVIALRSAGLGPVTGRLEETKSNLLCRDFWARCGFVRENGTWHLDDATAVQRPLHVGA